MSLQFVHTAALLINKHRHEWWNLSQLPSPFQISYECYFNWWNYADRVQFETIMNDGQENERGSSSCYYMAGLGKTTINWEKSPDLDLAVHIPNSNKQTGYICVVKN
jgi:hypothetical protein